MMPRPSNRNRRLKAYNEARKDNQINEATNEEENEAFEVLESDNEGSEADYFILELGNDQNNTKAMRKLKSMMDLQWWDGADEHIKKANRLGDGTSKSFGILLKLLWLDV
jgi:hypothetical protein